MAEISMPYLSTYQTQHGDDSFQLLQSSMSMGMYPQADVAMGMSDGKADLSQTQHDVWEASWTEQAHTVSAEAIGYLHVINQAIESAVIPEHLADLMGKVRERFELIRRIDYCKDQHMEQWRKIEKHRQERVVEREIITARGPTEHRPLSHDEREHLTNMQQEDAQLLGRQMTLWAWYEQYCREFISKGEEWCAHAKGFIEALGPSLPKCAEVQEPITHLTPEDTALIDPHLLAAPMPGLVMDTTLDSLMQWQPDNALQFEAGPSSDNEDHSDGRYVGQDEYENIFNKNIFDDPPDVLDHDMEMMCI